MTLKNGLPCVKCGTSKWDKRGNCVFCQRERSRRHQAENSEKMAERTRRWKAANPDKKAEQVRRWRAANPDEVAEHDRRYRAANPEKKKAKDHRRRTHKTQAGGSFTAAEWKALVAHQNGRCLACGKKANLTADHVIPVAKGGTSNIDNIQGLCGPCNFSKGNKIIDYRTNGGFLRWIQRKLFD